jgi:hypothetical protein
VVSFFLGLFFISINKTKEATMKLEIEELLDLADGNKE